MVLILVNDPMSITLGVVAICNHVASFSNVPFVNTCD